MQSRQLQIALKLHTEQTSRCERVLRENIRINGIACHSNNVLTYVKLHEPNATGKKCRVDDSIDSISNTDTTTYRGDFRIVSSLVLFHVYSVSVYRRRRANRVDTFLTHYAHTIPIHWHRRDFFIIWSKLMRIRLCKLTILFHFALSLFKIHLDSHQFRMKKHTLTRAQQSFTCNDCQKNNFHSPNEFFRVCSRCCVVHLH